jgi:hypothetical protein
VSATQPPPVAHTHATLGHPRVHLRRTDSTNERARELAIAGAPHGTLVTAAEQTAGRGRQGRRWSAPAGSAVLMSLLLREPPELLPLMAAVAVCDAVGERALIKWPNDVIVNVHDSAGGPSAGDDHHAGEQRSGPLAKLAGILVEARLQERWAVLGIGLNVAVRLEDLPAELRPGGAQPCLPRRWGSRPATWNRCLHAWSARSSAGSPRTRPRRLPRGASATPYAGARSCGQVEAGAPTASTGPGD